MAGFEISYLVLFLVPFFVFSSANLHIPSENSEANQDFLQAIKRIPFEYYTGDVIEFRKRPQDRSQENIEQEDDNPILNLRKRRTPTSSHRRSRSATMELLVVIDTKLYEKHKQAAKDNPEKQSIKKYYEYFIGYINRIYENASPEFKITVIPAGIVVIKNKNTSDWSEDNRASYKGVEFIIADSALGSFRRWLEIHKSRLPPFDHAMALTAYSTGIQFGSEIFEIKGIANVGQMCEVFRRITSVSLVHDSGTLSSALAAAHEIAHCIGLNHDGEGSSSPCPDEGKYLMSASLAMSDSANKFSTCSQRKILSFLRTPQAQCLFERLPRASKSRRVTTNILPGQLYNHDMQCQKQKMAGFTSPRFCKNPWIRPFTLELSCTALYCQDGDKVSTRCAGATPAIMGTPCGNKKLCLNHRCVEDDSAPCCPLDKEDEAYCLRLRNMGYSCTNSMMRLYCCNYCNYSCSEE